MSEISLQSCPVPHRQHWTVPVSREEMLAVGEKFRRVGWRAPHQHGALRPKPKGSSFAPRGASGPHEFLVLRRSQSSRAPILTASVLADKLHCSLIFSS